VQEQAILPPPVLPKEITVVWEHQHQVQTLGVVEVEQTILEEMAQQALGMVVVEGLEKHRPLLEHQLLVQVVEGEVGILLVAPVEVVVVVMEVGQLQTQKQDQ
jgi:hypothetical protein